MAKGKKKDPAKKLALAAKKDAKADKAARKRMQKESNAVSAGDPDAADASFQKELEQENLSLDDLLNVYRKRDVEGTKAIVESLDGFPPPRGNFSMTVVEEQKGKQEVYIFGGEYFDGIENIVVDHLLKWTHNTKDDTHEWKQIVMPSSLPSPPARCAHSTVYYNGSLYVFGGELATADYYHHYKDLWKYDIKNQTWTELTSRTGTLPSSRSGHSAIVWKHYMVLFGGFYEAARETPRWFNDVFVFDLKTEQWMDVPHSKLGSRPEPRSACNIALINDTVVLHGGFSKLACTSATEGKETKVHTDAWLLNLKPILQGKPPTWEKLLSSSGGTGRGSLAEITNTRNPNGRAAAACATYKNRMLVFGGVVDAELMHHKVDSVFFNDLFCLDVEPKPRWFPLTMRKQANSNNVTENSNAIGANNSNGSESQKGSDDKKTTENGDDDSSGGGDDISVDEGADEDSPTKGWSIDQLRENMSAFIDGSGNVVYEKLDKVGSSELNNPLYAKPNDDSSDEEEECKAGDESDEEKEEEKEDESRPASGKKQVKLQADGSTTKTTNPTTKTPQSVHSNEPLPRIKCATIVHRNTLFIYGGLVEIGDREVTLDDMWSFDLKKRNQWKCVWPGTMHKQVWRGAVHDDDDSYISTGADDDEDDSDGSDEAEESKRQSKDKAGGNPEIADLGAKHDLSNKDRTPEEGEVLADFFSRTSSYWNEQALEMMKQNDESVEPSKKEIKREGFQLARKRFEELEPVMERLKELSLGNKPSKSKSKKKSKK